MSANECAGLAPELGSEVACEGGLTHRDPSGGIWCAAHVAEWRADAEAGLHGGMDFTTTTTTTTTTTSTTTQWRFLVDGGARCPAETEEILASSAAEAAQIWEEGHAALVAADEDLIPEGEGASVHRACMARVSPVVRGMRGVWKGGAMSAAEIRAEYDDAYAAYGIACWNAAKSARGSACSSQGHLDAVEKARERLLAAQHAKVRLEEETP